jgi:hypothetical protein
LIQRKNWSLNNQLMKIFLLSFFIIYGSSLKAQVWIDSGAVWHYHFSSPWTVGYNKLVYTKDTLINGQLCQKITREGYTFMYDSDPNIFYQFPSTPAEPEYTFVSNDTVFYLADDGFRILCDFGAQVGETWVAMTYTNNAGNFDSLVITVVEIGTLDINNVTFRYVDLQSNSCGNYGYGGRFVERFGFYGSTNFSGLSNFPYVSDC